MTRDHLAEAPGTAMAGGYRYYMLGLLAIILLFNYLDRLALGMVLQDIKTDLHLTDTHAQLRPVFFREPSVKIGVGAMRARPPHLVGSAFLEHFGIAPGTRSAHAFTFLDFQEAAQRYGRMGGFAHLKTLIDRLRADAGPGNSVLLDGGDLWQGSGLANLTNGRSMVQAANLLGIDAMTGHFEFTYGEETLRKNLDEFKRRVFGSERLPHGRSQVQRRQSIRSRFGTRVQALHD